MKKGALNLTQTVPAVRTRREGFDKPSEVAGIHVPSASPKTQRPTSTNALILSPAPKSEDVKANGFCHAKTASASKHGTWATGKRRLEPTLAMRRFWVDGRCHQRLCTL